MAWSQDERPFRLKTPLGPDTLLLVSFEGDESVTSLYRFSVVAWSERANILSEELLLKPVTLEMRLPNAQYRRVHGVVSRFSRGGKAPDGYSAYELEIVPPHWMLDLGEGFDIFQNKSARDVCEQLLRGTQFEWRLVRTHEPRPYTFRYRETRWHCISRLLEQEGIWYRFDHSGSEPKLVLGDNSKSATEQWLAARLEYRAQDLAYVDMIANACYDVREDAQPYLKGVKVRSANEFSTTKNIAEEVTSSGRFSPPPDMKSYEFDQQAGAQRSGISHSGGDTASDAAKLAADARAYAKLRQELSEAGGTTFTILSRASGVTAGAKVEVQHAATIAAGGVFVTAVHHTGSNGGYRAGDEAKASYENRITAVPLDTVFRPARVTSWPRVHGSHVGTVVGPANEEIYTDKHGRVQVVFKWDLDDAKQLDRSCWIRVAQTFAGQNFGAVFLPRIGHEVIVDFLDGNPDNPVVVGSLYNSANLPPWPLPDNKTQSGVRTKSTLKGGADDFNELRFEDKKEAELIYVQAQKDMQTLVKNDERRNVKHDRTTVITNNEEKTVEKGFEKTTIAKGEQIITVADNNRTLHVEKDHTVTVNGEEKITVTKDRTITVKENQKHEVTKNDSTKVTGKRSAEITQDETIQVKTGNYKLTVDTGNIDIRAKMGNITLKADMGAIKLEAMQKVEIKVGTNTVTIDPTGVQVKGTMVKIEGQAMTEVSSSAVTQVKGGAMVKVQGGITMIN
jgi:type VI secretion system secreted protein VgrG